MVIGPVAAETAREDARAGEDREETTFAVPHAHQPGATGVCVSGVRHVDRNTLHGR